MTIVDFGRPADDYARHRAGFPTALTDRLAARGIGGAGQDVVDLGSRGFLGRVTALLGERSPPSPYGFRTGCGP